MTYKDNNNMDKQSYDVQDVIDAGYTLEPLKCRFCASEHDVTYNQYVNDALCEVCGKWQIEDSNE